MDYEAKSTGYNEKMQIYLAVSTKDINPIAIKEDLDLFKAKTVHKKLTDLGVDCAVVKVDYEGQTFEQIN